jgi:hypothetical protein
MIVTTAPGEDYVSLTTTAFVLQVTLDLIAQSLSAVLSLIAMAAALILCAVGAVSHSDAFREMKVQLV